MDEFNQLPDALLDSALNELPLVPPPPELTTQVLADILAAQRATAPVRFRLQFLDIALALFWSLILITISLATLWWTGLLRADWLPQVHPPFLLAGQLSAANGPFLLAGIILLVLEMSILGLIGVNVLEERSAAP